MNARSIYLTKHYRVALDSNNDLGAADESTPALVATFCRNLESVGFTFSAPLYDRLLLISAEGISRLYKEVVPVLRGMVGAHRRWQPMYPNFPAQVMNATDAELYRVARLHYFTASVADAAADPGYVWLPSFEKKRRKGLAEATRVRVVDVGSTAEFEGIFAALVSSNASLSPSDRDIVSWFVSAYGADCERLLPEQIPQKETLAYVVAAFASLPTGIPEGLTARVRTATDVLRVAVGLSEGDVSLASPPRFRKLSRPERRFLLAALERLSSDPTEDMLRYKGYWTRLGERLHPGEFKSRYPRTFSSFSALRERTGFTTFASRIEAALRARDVPALIGDLVTRPGDFARRLDHVLRLCDSVELRADVVGAFTSVASRVSTPVLLQARHHFATRDGASARTRVFFPKGNVGKMQVSAHALPSLDESACTEIVSGIEKVLTERFSAFPKLGNVFVDLELRSQMVPYGDRSASAALRTLARGSQLPISGKNFVRFFLWWKEKPSERTDIDLSVVFFDKDWASLGQVSYFALRDYGCVHSGDVTSAPSGACEFIDVDRSALVGKGIRYVAMSVNSFTGQSFDDLPECFTGWMERDDQDAGGVFDARTVENRVDVASKTTMCIPAVFDITAGRVIWADLSVRSTHLYNNVHSNAATLSQMARAISELNKPTLYDLFRLHAQGRGTLVDSAEEADTVFSLHSGITPFDTDLIKSEFLVG